MDPPRAVLVLELVDILSVTHRMSEVTGPRWILELSYIELIDILLVTHLPWRS